MISRRAFLGGAGVGLAGVGLEWASLGGRFDHRRSAGAVGAGRFAESLRAVEEGASGVVHIGHSTHLVALGGRRILTDPWFYDPAFGALSHEVAPAVLPSELGTLDAILITHDHPDHADLRAIDEMDKRAAVLVATTELAARVRARGFRDVGVLAPWESRTFGGATITAVPALHDVYEVGYVLRAGDLCVYFAGDTALHPDLPAIAERFTPAIAILPCDGTRLAGGALHAMTPEEAVSAARMLRAGIVVPSHAEASFSDPVAGHLLASTVPGARHLLVQRFAREVPAVSCKVPLPGELVRLSPAMLPPPR